MLSRPARAEDAAAVAEVHVRTWQAAYEHVFGAERLATIDLGQRRAQWEARLGAAESRHGVFVAEDEESRIVGFAAAGASRDTEGEGELYGIYVLPEMWGSGAGPALLHAALRSMESDGFASAILWVIEDNPRARRFYEREGWTEDGERRDRESLGTTICVVRYRIKLG